MGTLGELRPPAHATDPSPLRVVHGPSPTHPSDCATCRDSLHVDTSFDGRVSLTWRVSADFSGDKDSRGAWSIPTMDADKVEALRSLAETADEHPVRRAALAVLRRVEGATLEQAVEPTPYGIRMASGHP